MELHPEATYRESKRGLVLASPRAGSVLFEHPRSHLLIPLLAQGATEAEIRLALGPPLQHDLFPALVGLDLVTPDAEAALAHENGATTAREALEQPCHSGRSSQTPGSAPRLSRSGVELPGIDRPARFLERAVLPVAVSTGGRVLLSCVVLAGLLGLALGRPDIPPLSSSPALEALLALCLGLGFAVLHELAHAVALVHFGRRPRNAGFGFYWGALSFYVDSTEAMTLGRRERVIQALVGLGVDVVTISACAAAAHLLGVLGVAELLAIVLWRLAIVGLADLVVNASPFLEVDGHWALADLLDEPDLAPRARRALGQRIRGRTSEERWLVVYGAASLLFGTFLVVASGWVLWLVSRDLVTALLAGNPGEVVLGVYVVGPVALSLALSMVGLWLELLLASRPTPEDASSDDGR